MQSVFVIWDFLNALSSTRIYNEDAAKELEERIAKLKPYWEGKETLPRSFDGAEVKRSQYSHVVDVTAEVGWCDDWYVLITLTDPKVIEFPPLMPI